MSTTNKDSERSHTLIVSGQSGAGKSTVIRALEDAGYFCIDNLPVVLLRQVLELCSRANISDLAVVIDIREREFLAAYAPTLERLRANGYTIETLFLTCDEEVLIRRFKETRRTHPLQGDGSIRDGISAERKELEAVRASANRIIDTSNSNVHDLRTRIRASFDTTTRAPLTVRIESFGFKNLLPREADYVFDVRFIPNPFFIPELKNKTGLDKDVLAYLNDQEDFRELLAHISALMNFVLPRAIREGKTQVVIGIGCTGGQHRSVALAEALKEQLTDTSYYITVRHRNLE